MLWQIICGKRDVLAMCSYALCSELEVFRLLSLQTSGESNLDSHASLPHMSEYIPCELYTSKRQTRRKWQQATHPNHGDEATLAGDSSCGGTQGSTDSSLQAGTKAGPIADDPLIACNLCLDTLQHLSHQWSNV